MTTKKTHVPMRKVSVANQKGGVGKSAIATNLGFFAAEKKKRILVVDLDGQSTTTNNLLADVSPNAMKASQLFFTDALVGELQYVTPVTADGGCIAVIVGDRDLNLVDENPDADEFQPARWLASFAADYDLCIIDPPPTLGKRLRAALIASDFVLMPFVPVRESTDGLNQLLETIETIRQDANSRLEYLGLLANKVNTRSAMQRRTLEGVAEMAGDMLLPLNLSERAAVSDNLAHNRPVWKNIGGASHRKAAEEMTGVCKSILTKVFK